MSNGLSSLDPLGVTNPAPIRQNHFEALPDRHSEFQTDQPLVRGMVDPAHALH